MSRLWALAVSLAALPALAQPAPPAPDWSDWTPLVGEWVADAGGPGSPSGRFTLAPDLQGRILVRKNYAEYPKSGNRPVARHDDLMIVYRDGEAIRADYWDNEGHLIHYAVTVEKKRSFVFLSDAVAGRPRFRLSYALDGADALSLRFEAAPPNAPADFKPYIQATMHRKR